MLSQLAILDPGSSERLKAGVHGAALGLALVMGLYNGAAWLRRRERHLAINAVLYAALTAWEQKLVSHHLSRLRADNDAERADAAPRQSTSSPAPDKRTVAATRERLRRSA